MGLNPPAPEPQLDQAIRILLVDDHELVRSGVRMLLESNQDMIVVGECDSGEDAIERSEQLAPDVVIMDLALGGINGFEATQRIVASCPRTHVLVLTMQTPEQALIAALDAGGTGFLRKTAIESGLLDAVRCVARGTTYADPELVNALRQQLARHPAEAQGRS